MRLLAYGGTRYAERARVGRWSESLRGTTSDFEDTFDIPTGQGLLSYGVGIVDDAAVLILRERQNESDRGGYPYTLLLDPGVDVWRRFEWNAPLLTCALRADTALWAELMHEPQRFSSTEVLEQTLQSLAPPALAKGTGPDVGPALAASLHAESLYVPIALIGTTTRPSVDMMASALMSLPPFVRVGGGWMMGGGRNGRKTLGCRLVFDDISPNAEADERTTTAIEEGRRLLQLSADVLGRPGTSDASDAFAQPSLAWSSPPGTLSKALAVASAGARGAIDKPAIDQIAAFLAEPTPYGPAVLDIWKRALAQGPLNAAVSRVLLKYDWERIDASLGARLSVDALSEAFHERRLTPASGAAQTFGLAAEREAAVWSGLVERATDANGIVTLVADALPRLGSAALTGPIVQRALERTLQIAGVLRAWGSLRDRADLWKIVGDDVSALARRRVGGDARWHLDYALLADDAGGTWLAGMNPDAVPAVVSALMDEMTTGSHGEAARAWLVALASTRARVQTELPQKLQLARQLGGRWSRLLVVESICTGETAGGPSAAVSSVTFGSEPTAEESRALVQEAGALLAVRAKRSDRPQLDLEALDRVFDGRLSVDALPQSATALAPVTHGSIEWLIKRGATPLARDLAVRSWLEGGPTAVPLSRMDEQAQAAVVSNLFNRTEYPVESERKLAHDLLKTAGQSSSVTLMTRIGDALTAAARDRQQSSRIAKMMASDADLTLLLLGWIEPRDAATLLQSAAEADAAGVARLVEEFIGHVSEHYPAAAIGALHALQEFLRRPTPASRAVRDRAGRALFGADAVHLGAYVDELRRTVEMEASHEERAHAKDLVRRVRNWFTARRH